MRRLKKRNLQQAAQPIVAFMREHPDLFIGVNLDPDVYINPFFSEAQWYDYNPGTLRQFREWLAGTGPYAAARRCRACRISRSYRREPPLSLRDVSGSRGGRSRRGTTSIRRARFRAAPTSRFWNDPWVREWETFRRHLVSLHYDELAQWLVEAGLPRDRIWSSQGLMAPAEGCMPLALNVDERRQELRFGRRVDRRQQAARRPSRRDRLWRRRDECIAMENGSTLFAHARGDRRRLRDRRVQHRRPAASGTAADVRRSLSRVARPVERGRALRVADGVERLQRRARRATRLRELHRVAQYAARRSRARLPARALGIAAGTKLWTFGTQAHADDDGWTVETRGADAVTGRASRSTPTGAASSRCISPRRLALHARRGSAVSCSD